MQSICYYVSDYGYGHASRSIAVVRRILDSFKGTRVFVKTSFPFDFVRRSLPAEGVVPVRTENDIGVAFRKGSAEVDTMKTGEMLDGWLDTWDAYVRGEREFCERNGVGLILSDIAPQPFIVAEELGIPGVAVSNFTWHYIFSGIFGSGHGTGTLRDAYVRAESALVLPFNEKMACFRRKRDVGLVSREPTRGREEIRRMLGVREGERLVYLGIGKSFDTIMLDGMRCDGAEHVRFLSSSHVRLPLKGALRIPPGETETQDFVAACDLVVSKPGYGIVSEAVRGKVPIFLFSREGFSEDGLFRDALARTGIGRTITTECFLNCGFLNELGSLDVYAASFDALPGRLSRDGADEVAGYVGSMLG
jgi:hypothetical protein